MRARPYQEFVAALVRLGCKSLGEDEELVTVCRFPVLVYVPKDPDLAVTAQRRILQQLGFDDADLLRAVRQLH